MENLHLDNSMDIISQIKTEIIDYRDGLVKITDNYSFSQHHLVKQIYNLANNIYPSGPLDTQGNYKYWFDIITPRINDETKNIDLDTKDISLFSEQKNDRMRTFFANALFREWMKETQQGVSLNEDIEESTGWGNMLLKKIKGDYLKLDFTKTIFTNPKAKSVNQTAVIEQHHLTNSELREKKGVYDDDRVDAVLASRSGKSFFDEFQDDEEIKDKKIPVYEIFERNGDVSLLELNNLRAGMGLEVVRNADDENTFVLAKIVLSLVASVEGEEDNSTVMYAQEIDSMDDIYKEYHRGRYSGRWFRKGFYESLMDIQIRCNDIGNEIARALEFGGKQIYTSGESSVYENVLTDMMRGDIIHSKDLKRVDMTVPEVGHYLAEWNHLMVLADRIANSSEVVQGGDLPSGTPFKLGALLNQNSNKFYVFIRQKLALSFKSVFDDWILPDLLKDFSAKDVVRITGDKDYLEEYYKMLVDNWYAANLILFEPHGMQEAQLIKAMKLETIGTNKEELASLQKGYWEGFEARVDFNIVGESTTIDTDVENTSSLLALEADPARRQFLLDVMWGKMGIDTTKLPKAAPIEGPLETPSGQPKPELTPQTA